MCAKCYYMQNSFMARYGEYIQACQESMCEDEKKSEEPVKQQCKEGANTENKGSLMRQRA